MGWNQLQLKENPSGLLEGIDNGAYVYFCHSYYCAPKDNKVIAAQTQYGTKFASVIWKDNVFGVQFHPEKSQKTGLRILKNFLNLKV